MRPPQLPGNPNMALVDPLSSVPTALQRESLIPDVLPESFAPSVLFAVAWPGGAETLLGNEVQKADVAEEPEVTITPMVLNAQDADSGGDVGQEATYTLTMFDPDAPSGADPKYRSFRHWVVSQARPWEAL
jgi:hypothetical protein